MAPVGRDGPGWRCGGRAGRHAQRQPQLGGRRIDLDVEVLALERGEGELEQHRVRVDGIGRPGPHQVARPETLWLGMRPAKRRVSTKLQQVQPDTPAIRVAGIGASEPHGDARQHAFSPGGELLIDGCVHRVPSGSSPAPEPPMASRREGDSTRSVEQFATVGFALQDERGVGQR